MPTPGGGVLTPGGAANAENPPPQARIVAMRANTHQAVHWIIVAVLEVKVFLARVEAILVGCPHPAMLGARQHARWYTDGGYRRPPFAKA
jgi:hypothetical protein